MVSLTSRTEVQALLARYGLAPHKKLGQNFLFDGNILRAIADAVEPEGKAILEIGPGLGALTQQLAQRARRVLAVEIDRGFLSVLGETLQPWGIETADARRVPIWEPGEEVPEGVWSEGNRAAILHADILKASLAGLYEILGGRFSVCANLPYYITTPILMSLLESGLPIDSIVVLVQKEMAERLAAQPSSKAYGSLSIAAQYYARSETLFDVSASCFLPAPNVDSTVLRLYTHETALSGEAEKRFFAVVRAGFAMRRKTLANNLRAAFPSLTGENIRAALVRCGFSADIRGEKLSIEQFMLLAKELPFGESPRVSLQDLN